MRIRERIEISTEKPAASDRELPAAILSDYPYAGLLSIQDLARRSEASTASTSRFVPKIELAGCQQFQRNLIDEQNEDKRPPVELHLGERSIEVGCLNDFVTRATGQMADSASAVTEVQFRCVRELPSEPCGDVYAAGGRVSDTIANHLSFHPRQARSGVYHLPENVETWPEYLSCTKHGDILFVVDFRRFQSNLLQLGGTASSQLGAQVVLMSDKWLSPIAKYAAEVLPGPTESGTLRDTCTPELAVAETIVTRIAEENRDQARARINAWDAIRFTDQEPKS